MLCFSYPLVFLITARQPQNCRLIFHVRSRSLYRNIYVGGAGQSPASSAAVGTSGGWNGGGNGGYLSSGSNAGGGGGASDVRTGGTAGTWTE